jgi:hypothetical protein
MHTREGYRSDLSHLPLTKKVRGRNKTSISNAGRIGCILVRGEPSRNTHTSTPFLISLLININ